MDEKLAKQKCFNFFIGDMDWLLQQTTEKMVFITNETQNGSIKSKVYSSSNFLTIIKIIISKTNSKQLPKHKLHFNQWL